ncbi:MAG TPA: heparan-alpha-glucosaminide N-acetyltransferase domain-containing protein [Bryobacteraceae bacterium]
MSQVSESAAATVRLSSVDILRGLVMVIMALDHTRDFFSNSAALFDPTDLSRTNPLLFFTRWITHFCAPVFVFLAGSGAYLSLARGHKDTCDVAKFLITRGLWLIFLEIFVVSPLGWSFSLSFGFTRLQVIWVIGVSMMLLGGLILIWPSRIIGGVGLVMIFAHDLLDGTGGVWKILHQTSFFEPWPHKIVASLYPLIPWVGVMMAGYAAGEVLTFSAVRRRRSLFWLGGMLTALFVILRASNVYGDPLPWSTQASPIFSVMSFLRCSKYPPSLLYLLMTLSPALIVLALIDGADGWFLRFRDFGRVPLFYYVLHLPLLHAIAVLFSFAAYGSASWLCQDLMGIKGSPHPLPPGYGYSLPVVYAVWLGTVLVLYPACRWFASVKKNRRAVVFSYL